MKFACRWVVLCMCLELFAVACGEGGSGENVLIVEDGESVSQIVVEPEELLLAVHESRVLRGEAQDEAGAVVAVALGWTSEDEGIAVVDGDGQVVGVGAGQTKIVVTAGGQSASVEVTVRALEYRSVAAGTDHSCAVTWSGDVYCWGGNDRAQLSLEDTKPVSVPVAVDLPDAMASVTVGVHHSCALSRDGQAYCWGFNDYLQVGVVGSYGYMVPPTPIRGPRYQAISAGDYHTCGLTLDGELYCWGENSFGLLGVPGIANSQSPQKVALDSKLKQVVVGEYNTCVLDVEGKAHCFGHNGGRTLLPFEGENSFVPVRAGGDVLFTSLAVGSYSMCGLTTQGQTLCWGEEVTYSRGRAEIDTYLPRPIDSNERFVALSGDTFSFCGLKDDGQLHCWGNNGAGQLGDGTTTSRLPGPVAGARRWSSVAMGETHSCGIELDGSLWCWGYNAQGQLGDGRTLVYSAPVRAEGQALRLESLMSSNAGTCGKEKGSRRYFCWGDNSFLQFGRLGEGGHATKPTQAQYPDRQWHQLSIAYGHSCGLTGLGKAYCWGTNRTWQLGNGYTGVGSWAIGEVAGNLQFDAIYAGYQQTCALTREGKAYCWGFNGNGQLGSNVSDGSPTPLAVSTNLRFVELALGSYHGCGLTEDGAVHCWGENRYGVLGSRSAPDRATSPVEVPLDEPLVRLKSGTNHVCGLTADNVLYCWGYSGLGSLGDGATMPAPGAVKVGGRWTDFELGGWTTCALNLEGELYCWGYNTYHQVSAEAEPAVLTPRLVDPGFPVREFSVGDEFVCVLDESGHPYCWGLNSVAQMGIESSYYLFSPSRVVGG